MQLIYVKYVCHFNDLIQLRFFFICATHFKNLVSFGKLIVTVLFR